MATIRAYTTIEQSRKLAEILPLESADMVLWGKDFKSVYADIHAQEFMNGLEDRKMNYVPCWSLGALLDVLPEGTRLLKSANISSVGDIKYHCDCPKGNIDKWFDNPIDACYELIIKTIMIL